MLAYGSCVGDWYRFARNVSQPLHGRPIMALSGQTSLCKAYNTILDALAGDKPDAVILLHDDLQILDPQAEAKFLAAMADDVALVGVAGGRSDQTLHWWNAEKVGHQYTNSGLLDFEGGRTGDVAFIEGSIMAFSPWAIENLRFDERYPGFAGYDDICVTALKAGKRNVVADVSTHHHAMLGWRSEQRKAEFWAAEEIFREKWGIQS